MSSAVYGKERGGGTRCDVLEVVSEGVPPRQASLSRAEALTSKELVGTVDDLGSTCAQPPSRLQALA